MPVAALDLGHPAGGAERPPAHTDAPRAIGRVRVVGLLRFAMVGLLVAQLGRIPLIESGVGFKEAPLLFNDFAVLLLLAATTLLAFRHRGLRIDGPAACGLAFATVGGLSAALAIPRFGLSAFEFAFSIAYLLRWLAYFAIYLAVINFVRREEVPSVWRMLDVTILVFAAFGILQSAFLPGFAQIVYLPELGGPTWDQQGRRLVSTFLDPNFAGMFIAVGLLVNLARMSFGVRTPWWTLLLLFAALVLTLSRGAAVAFLVGVFVIALVRGHSRRILRFGGAALFLFVAATPLLLAFAEPFNRFSVGGSAVYRFLAWIRGVEVFIDNPIIGVGFNTFGFVQREYGYDLSGLQTFGLDGGLLFVAVLTGLVGLTFFAGMFFLVISRCRYVWTSTSYSPEERGIALGVAALSAAWLVNSLFLGSLFYPFLMEPIWMLWGLTLVIPQRDEGERSSVPDPPAVPGLAIGTRG